MNVTHDSLDAREAALVAAKDAAEADAEKHLARARQAGDDLSKIRAVREELVAQGMLERRDDGTRGDRADEPQPEAAAEQGLGPTVREIIIQALRVGQLWQSANDIRDAAPGIGGRDVPMSSISPTLTKMKNDGEIVRDGVKKIALRSRLEIEEPMFLNENGEAAASPDAEPAQADTLLGPQNSTHAA